MLTKKILLAAAALGFSGFALADPPHWAPAHGWRANHYGYYHAPRAVYVAPAPRIVYAPPPRVVYHYAAPVVVHPAPVYVPAPVYSAAPGVSIRFSFPL